jgi:Tfp pilus assembly protein PilP
MKTILKMLAILVALSFFAIPLRLEAQETTQGSEDKFVKQTYSYTSKNRRDPFFSIIEAAKIKKDAERKKKKRRGLAPLEDYAISQVKLIAIVWDKENQHYALIGLPDNKYYTITEGMSIGIHGGTVQDITQKSLVIREMLPDYKGLIRPEDTIIRLREEEGE